MDRKSGWPVFVDEIGEPVDLHTADGWRWLELPQQEAEELVAALGHTPAKNPLPPRRTSVTERRTSGTTRCEAADQRFRSSAA
ncbi:hypothetical protein [Amycolatopsis sp. lyj-23]|uniref:hypothetical protein n=1 Tax=Amycolatopsis sp. lyj-23 TaxID=2789283 RepID=UPI00397DFFF9